MKTFQELELHPSLLQAIEDMGFVEPMPIQEQVIPLMLTEANDIIALAQTGSGKTAAFGLPLIQHCDARERHTQALILCPTRELCLQISNALTDYSRYYSDINIVPVYGGASINEQIRQVRQGAQIIVATPGRLIDLIERREMDLRHIRRLILDEADEMLNMGFAESIDAILQYVPQERETLLFSATMPKEIAALTKKYMRDPVEITIGEKNAGAENVKHIYYTVHARDKYLTLKRIADYYPDIYAIVFCRTRRETQEVAEKLIHDGYNAEALHGDLSQAQREYVMQKFRIRNIQLLVATDVAARGIDVQDLTHVINYTLPEEKDIYTHRSGRTGRAGKAGISISIINMKENSYIRVIEKRIGKKFVQAKVPGGKEVCEKQLFHLIKKIETVEINDAEIAPFLGTLFKKLDWFDKEELIKRFISVEFNRFLEYYRNAVDLNQKESSSKGGSKSERKQKSSGGGGMTRLFINLGKVDGLYPQGLMKLLNSMTKGSKPDFGNIDIQKNFTLFEVEADAAPKLIAAFKHKEIEGRKIFIKADEDHKSPESRGKFSREKSDRKRPVSNESGFFRERDDNKRSKYPKKRGDDFRGKRKDSAKGKGDRRRRK